MTGWARCGPRSIAERKIGALHAGNSIFFAVKRIEDPIGLLPAKLILGINKVRSLFIRAQLHRTFHCCEGLLHFLHAAYCLLWRSRTVCISLMTNLDGVHKARNACSGWACCVGWSQTEFYVRGPYTQHLTMSLTVYWVDAEGCALLPAGA